MKVEDSLKFYTDQGRVVYGGGGINPDYFVAIDTSGRSDWLYDIFASNVINTFVFDYVDEHQKELMRYHSAQEFHDNFHINKTLFNSFVDYTKKEGISNTKSQIQHSEGWMKMRIKSVIARQEWNEEGFFRAVNHSDSMMLKALEILYQN
jgi:carboxyl-terminal processing protease